MPAPAALHRPEKHRFEIDVEGEAAVALYERSGGRLFLTHTEVPEAHEGEGLGGTLAEAALAYARAEGLEVVPLCPFMAAYVRRHPQHQDLVPARYRT